jgi:Rod binding domain-containing protein
MTATAPPVALPAPPPQGLPSAAPPKPNLHPGNDAKMRTTAEGFETMFLNQMFELMGESVQADPTFGGGQAENIFRSMLSEQYAKQMAKGGGIGISNAVYQEMVRLQETAR